MALPWVVVAKMVAEGIVFKIIMGTDYLAEQKQQ